jgi:hypothetical protein
MRASRLVAVRTPRGERRLVLRLDAPAEGSGAVDEPPCPRHGNGIRPPGDDYLDHTATPGMQNCQVPDSLRDGFDW